MNWNPEEEKLRELFGEMKRADDQRAAPFDRAWAAAGTKKDSFFAELRYGRIVAAVAIALIVAASVPAITARLSRPRTRNPSIALKVHSESTSDVGPAVGQPPMSLANWESPTAFLLRAPDEWGQTDSSDEPANGAPSTQPQPQLRQST